MNCKVLFTSLSLVCAGLFAYGQRAVYLDDNAPMEKRVEDALSRMTLEEKVAMCHAQSKFSSAGVPRLGIPENWATDGPHGVRPEVYWDQWDMAGWTNDSCTAFPALTCLAATWNKSISAAYGTAIGEEARYRNKNILLGPGVNIYRTPLNGRNFEYMGEDPYLSASMVVPYVKGVQSNGVAACVKHFALNNQEARRHTVNITVSDRALYEIYLPAFKAAVTDGRAWAIMGAYNKYKNQWACQNEYLLQDILRKEWHFDGVVVSDWGGVNNTEEAATRGLDMEFGTWTDGLANGVSNAYDNYFLANPYLKLLREGKLPVAQLDEKVRNILRLAFRTTMNRNRPFGRFTCEEHSAVARAVADEGIVLLKNTGNLLPLDLRSTKRIAVVGENAIRMMTVGGGSSQLKAKYEVSPLDGIKHRFAGKAEVLFARGYKGVMSGKQDGIDTDKGIKESRSPEELHAEALKVAREADVVIFVGGLNKSPHQDCEDADRQSYGLPYGQDELIADLAAANRNLVVLITSGNAVAMPWVKKVPAILQSWYLGSEAGNAIADVLSGDVNPSGKLPVTYYASLSQVGAESTHSYDPKSDDITYKEDIFVGYRWIDKNRLKPTFAFGHGLSYTTFAYGKLTADKPALAADGSITLSIPVTNTGMRDGAEVVQLYVSDVKCAVARPVKELKGFEKVSLRPGETKTVTFTLDKNALSYFDEATHSWVAEPGQFKAMAGAASDDIRSTVAFDLR